MENVIGFQVIKTDSWDAEAILELYISVDNELAYERYSELILQTTVE